MANNRMYLRCKACGEEFYLGKHFMNGWYYENYHRDSSLEKQLNEFYNEHIYCNGFPLECFEIHYEFEVKDYAD